MAKTKGYTVTMEQGQFLLGLAQKFSMPEKLGTAKQFSAIERVAAERDVLALYDAIKTVSPFLRKSTKEQANMFGPEENWEIKRDVAGKLESGDVKDTTQVVDLPLSERAVSGAMWCLLLCTHPDSPHPRAGAKIMSDVLIPLAFRLRRLAALEDELGLRNAASKRWEETEEPDEVEADRRAEPRVVVKATEASG